MSMPILAIYVAFAFSSFRVWWPQGRLAVNDRWALLTGLASSLAGCALVYALVDWVTVPNALWYVAVFVLASGVIGTVLRWSDVSWLAGAASIGRAVRVTITLIACGLGIAGAIVSTTA